MLPKLSNRTNKRKNNKTMNGIELRKGIITNLATDIINKQLAAMLAMQRDMESTFEERKEEMKREI